MEGFGDPYIQGYLTELSETDREGYRNLKQMISTLDNFSDILSAVHEFSIRNDEGDSSRCRACGICWLSECIAVNTNQLSVLIGRATTVLNSGFSKCNYKMQLPTDQFRRELFEVFPNLETNSSELRQWTYRKLLLSGNTSVFKNHMPGFTPRSMSPKPKLNLDTNQRRTNRWSYEDYAMQESEPQENTEDAIFFDDPFCIPMQSWSDESSSQKCVSVFSPYTDN